MKVQSITKKAIGMGTTLSVLATSGVYAQLDGGVGGGIEDARTGESPEEIPVVLQNIIRILLWVVGAASVVMLIIGGIRYTVSAGDQQAVANAKNTILYAIVGIVVAVLAWAAVSFVFDSLTGTA